MLAMLACLLHEKDTDCVQITTRMVMKMRTVEREVDSVLAMLACLLHEKDTDCDQAT